MDKKNGIRDLVAASEYFVEFLFATLVAFSKTKDSFSPEPT
jgi:hypothetical protein